MVHQQQLRHHQRQLSLAYPVCRCLRRCLGLQLLRWRLLCRPRRQRRPLSQPAPLASLFLRLRCPRSAAASDRMQGLPGRVATSLAAETAKAQTKPPPRRPACGQSCSRSHSYSRSCCPHARHKASAEGGRLGGAARCVRGPRASAQVEADPAAAAVHCHCFTCNQTRSWAVHAASAWHLCTSQEAAHAGASCCRWACCAWQRARRSPCRELLDTH